MQFCAVYDVDIAALLMKAYISLTHIVCGVLAAFFSLVLYETNESKNWQLYNYA